MMGYFTAYVIGGRTGKRESAWFAFFLWLVFSAWIGRATYAGSADGETAFLEAMWNTVTPFVLVWLGGAHGLEWAEQKGRLTGTPERATPRERTS